jgi:hypothetical protein
MKVDYIFSPEAKTKRYGAVWCNSVDFCERRNGTGLFRLAAVPNPFAVVIR